MGANQANVRGYVRLFVGGNAGLCPNHDDGSTNSDDNDSIDKPLPPWKDILKDTCKWDQLLLAARALDILTAKLIRNALLNDDIAAWTDDTLALADVAVVALEVLPGFGVYNASKVLRIPILWVLTSHGVPFPPGKQPYDWEHMSVTMPEKAAFLVQGGLDPNCPEGFVRAILHGGAGFPPDAYQALTALLDAWMDWDIGVTVCEIGRMCTIMCQRNALCNMDALLLLLQHIGTSKDPMCTVLRQEGVNAYSLSLLTNERPLTEKDPRSALLHLRLVRRTKDPRSALCATKDFANRKEACDRWLRHFHPITASRTG